MMDSHHISMRTSVCKYLKGIKFREDTMKTGLIKYIGCFFKETAHGLKAYKNKKSQLHASKIGQTDMINQQIWALWEKS